MRSGEPERPERSAAAGGRTAAAPDGGGGLRRRSLPVFGPTRAAAMLETSKAFAKRFMQRHNIPTANYAACTSQQQAFEALELFHHLPVVIKADGLAAGKGVLICESKREAQEAITGLYSGKLLGTVEH